MQVKPKILLVEDDRSIRFLVKRLLENCTIEIIMVNSGDEALNACNKEKMDLILMDIRMPGMDGYETAVHIKETQSANSDVPIIAITAAICDPGIHAYGIDTCLEKPFDIFQLYKTINDKLGSVCK